MSLYTDTVIDRIMARATARWSLTDSGDASDGEVQEIGDVQSFTLFLKVEGATQVQIELSPDGTEWFEPGKASNTPAESPIKFEGAGTEIVQFAYDADAIRVTTSDGTPITAKVQEVV